MSTLFITATLIGDMYQSTIRYKDVPVKVQDYMIYANLIFIDMMNYDIILSIDWSLTHHTVIDCQKKCVRFWPLKAKSFEFQRIPQKRGVLIISSLKARKLLVSRRMEILASTVDPSKKIELKLDESRWWEITCRYFRKIYLDYHLIGRLCSTLS